MRTAIPIIMRLLCAALCFALCMTMAGFYTGVGIVPPAVDLTAPENDGTAEPPAAVVPEIPLEPLPLPEVTAEPLETEAPTVTAEPETAVPPLPMEQPAAPVQEDPAQAVLDGAGEWNDPLYWKMQYSISTVAVKEIPRYYQDFRPRQLAAGETLRKGVDVSNYQGNVRWEQVAANGVEFAIIRAAYRGVTEANLYTDSKALQNLSGAKAAGLKVGAYIFSQALTPEEAREEARYLVSVVKGYQLDMPLALDFEYAGGRLQKGTLTRQEATDVYIAFRDEARKLGYQTILYSNPSTLREDMYREQIDRVWLAHWTAETDHASAYEIWQCGQGPITGIDGDVDLDFWFDTSGQPGNTVTPDASATPEPTATPVPTATPEPTPSPTPAIPPVNNPFRDVPANGWFYDSVLWAYGRGIVNGLSATSFGPGNTATRGQLVAMLYRMEGSPAVTGVSGFADLTEDYYRDAVTWAAENKIVGGFTSTIFGPNNKITREQLAAMLYRMAGSPEVNGDLSGFTDAGNVQEYARSAMMWAAQKGIITGYDNNTILPGASATRAEVCTMLFRFETLG